MVINKKALFKFYYQFYRSIVLKEKDVEIYFGQKLLDSKNSILFSFLDFKEILNNLIFKKGTLFYEYLCISLNDLDLNLNEEIFNSIIKINQELIQNINIDVDYDIDEDLEKILLNVVNFKCIFNVQKIDLIYNTLLEKIVSNNMNKIFIIFYDSDLLKLNINNYDNCYSFDISLSEKEYNLICNEEIKYFNIDCIIDKLEGIWPIEFNKNKIQNYIIKYFSFQKANLFLEAYNEVEYLVYVLLNKMFNCDIIVQNNCLLSNNVKSFLTKI